MGISVRFGFILILALLTLVRPAWGTIASSQYEVQLPTQTQDEKEWHELCHKGLEQIFARTLDGHAVSHPEIQKALKHADDFVEQYYYNDDEIVIKFSAILVQEIAKKVGTPIVAKNRPTANIVLWLAVEEKNERRLVGVESDPQLQTYINQLATQKNMPLILPLMDLEDMAQVTVTDVWGQFPSVLTQASQRYNAQTMLIARLSRKENGEVEGQWQLVMGHDAPVWQTRGTNIEENLTQGISVTQEHLKAPTQPMQSGQSTREWGRPYFIAIDNIDSSDHFRQVAHYLKTLDGVADVRIQQIIGQSAVFEITPMGREGRSAFEQALLLDGRLAIERRDSFPAEVAQVYRWGGKPNTAFEIEEVVYEQQPLEMADEPDEPASD